MNYDVLNPCLKTIKTSNFCFNVQFEIDMFRLSFINRIGVLAFLMTCVSATKAVVLKSAMVPEAYVSYRSGSLFSHLYLTNFILCTNLSVRVTTNIVGQVRLYLSRLMEEEIAKVCTVSKVIHPSKYQITVWSKLLCPRALTKAFM